MQRFQGGLIFQAPRWLYHSTLGSRVIKKRREVPAESCRGPSRPRGSLRHLRGRERVVNGQPTGPNPLYHRDDWVDRPSDTFPHGGVQPFHQKSTCLTQLTLGPYLVQSWSRNTPKNSPNEPLVLHRVATGGTRGLISCPTTLSCPTNKLSTC